MIYNIPSDQPVLVFTSYRTGSTALCNQIANNLNYRNFDETYHPTLFQERRQEFVEYKKHNSDFVWKLMPDQITSDNHSDIIETWQQCYAFKLTRRDNVAQIASWYISHATDKWHQVDDHLLTSDNVWHENTETLAGKTVPVDDTLLDYCIKSILTINQLVDQLPDQSYDQHLIYEDLSLKDSEYVPRSRPENYPEIIKRIHTLVDQYRTQ